MNEQNEIILQYIFYCPEKKSDKKYETVLRICLKRRNKKQIDDKKEMILFYFISSI
jgi:hypothetical protein